MTRIWNPYVFTPLGNPIVGEAPPTLRVMGGMQATAQQLSYAQQRFTQFVMQARLSTVPNPTEAGRLPDGTAYRIVVVGPLTTMEIWPGGGAAQKVLSGIMFWPSRTLLVNDGKMDAPSAKWRVVPISTDLFEGVPDSGRRLTVSKRTSKAGTGQYFYADAFGRYGNSAAFVFGTPGGSGGLVGMTPDGRLDLFHYSNATHQLQIYRSKDKDTYKLLPEYGAKNPDPLNPKVLTVYPAEVIVAANPGSAIVAGPAANKRGDRIAFATNHYEPIVIGVDFVPGEPLIYRTPYPFSGVVHEAGAADGLISVTGPSSQSTWRYKQTSADRISVSSRDAGGQFLPPQTMKLIPLPAIEPATRFTGSVSGDGGVVFSNNITSVTMSNIEHPRDVVTGVYGISRQKFDGFDLLTYDVDTAATGGIGFKLERDEDASHVRSLEYTGVGELVPTTVRERLSYTQDVFGDMDFRQTHHISGDDVPPGGAPSIKVGDFNATGAAKSRHEQYGATSVVHMKRETVLSLGAQEQEFVEYREVYDETGNFLSIESSVDDFSYLENTEYSASIEFTLHKEVRTLLVFDPAWSLMCYTELVTTVSNTGNTQRTVTYSGTTPTIVESNSGGGPLPPEPDMYIVVKFRGAETRFKVPFLSEDRVDDTTRRRNSLRHLYPATGIAPGTPVNGSFDTIGGFYTFDVSRTPTNGETLLYGANLINIYDAPPADPIVVPAVPWAIRGVSSSLLAWLNGPVVTYKKTPETGAALLTIYYSHRGVVVDKRYLFDAAGMRDADAVVSGIPPTNSSPEAPRGPF